MSDSTTRPPIELAELTIKELEQTNNEFQDTLMPAEKLEHQKDRARELTLELQGLDADILALRHQGKLAEADELKRQVDAIKARFEELKNK